jgi:hypothetical protein
MDAFSLVAAHLLECNRFTYDPRDEDVIVLKAVRRRAKWRRRLSTIAALLALARRRLQEVVKTGRRHRQALEWTRA